MKEKNNKNLNKLKKELLKIFENSISISQEKNIEKENNSNLIDLPTLESDSAQAPTQTILQNPENINISINLPNELQSKNINKIVKSPSSNRRYNIDIKKNETPVYLFLNKNYEDKVHSDLLYPKNILNYFISQDNNFLEKQENNKDTKNYNKKDNLEKNNFEKIILEKYKTLIQNFKANKETPKEKKFDVIRTETFLTNPYTFFTNSKNLYLLSENTKNEINENNDFKTNTNTTNDVQNNKSFVKNENTNIKNIENINSNENNNYFEAVTTNQNNTNISTNNSKVEIKNKTDINKKTETTNKDNVNYSDTTVNEIIKNEVSDIKNSQNTIVNESTNTLEDVTNVFTENNQTSNIVKNVNENNIEFERNYSNNFSDVTTSISNTTNNSKNNNVKFFDSPKYFDIRKDIKNFTSRSVTVKQLLENRNTILTKNNEFLIPAFMDGGIVTKPTVALVGEKEPEILIPKSKLPDLLSSETGNKQKSALEKTQIEQQTNQLVRSGKQTNIEAIKAIKDNTQAKEEMKDLDTITKEVNSSKTQNPKSSTNSVNPNIPTGEDVDVSLPSVDSITTTKGTSIFRDMHSPMPIWRIYQG